MTSPVLFLDIDETIAFSRVALALPDSDKIDPVSAAMIVRICERTGAKIVVSSVWRSSPAVCARVFDAHGITPHLWSPIVLPTDLDEDGVDDHADGHDDDRDAWRVEAQNASRSTAIRNWLALHPEVTVWAIADDSFQDFDQEMLGRLVHTDMMFGIGIREYSRAVRLLSGDEVLSTREEAADYQHPRHTISNLAAKALAALDEGDDDAVRQLLSIIRDEPLAQ